MKDEKQSWFIRYTITRNGNSETTAGIITGDNPSNAFNSFIQHLVETLEISRFDIDILAMNRV